MYAVDGARDLAERELPHLPGYAGSRPVRIGNGAVSQRQSDVLGTVMVALELTREAHGMTAPRGRCSARWSTSWRRTGGGPTTACGRSAGRAAGSPTPA